MPSASNDKAFAGAIPVFYEEYLVPEAFAARFGQDLVDAKMQAHVVVARR